MPLIYKLLAQPASQARVCSVHVNHYVMSNLVLILVTIFERTHAEAL